MATLGAGPILQAQDQDGADPAHSLTTAPATTIDFFGQQANRFPRYVIRTAGQWAW